MFSEQLTRLFKENPDPKHPYFVFDINRIERCLIGFADRIGELLHTRAMERERRER